MQTVVTVVSLLCLQGTSALFFIDEMMTWHLRDNETMTMKGFGPEESGLSKSRKKLPEPSARPPGCINIEFISEKELLLIFSLLSLSDLQSLELVSREFRRIALIVYSDRRSLSLIQTPLYRDNLDDITRYWYFIDYITQVPFGEDCYKVTREVNSIGVEWFGERFSKVTQLTLYCVDYLSLDRFVELIKFYPTLELLVLFSTDSQQSQYNRPSFWNALYGLRESLHHLHLPFSFNGSITQNPLTPLLSPHLKTLFFQYTGKEISYWDYIRGVPHALQRLGVFRKNNYFMAGFYYQSWTYIEQPEDISDGTRIAGTCKQQMAQVTRYGIYVGDIDDHIYPEAQIEQCFLRVKGIAQLFAMTHLNLTIQADVDLLSILFHLSTLTRLTHIRFTIKPIGLTAKDSRECMMHNFFAKLTRNNYHTELVKPKRTLPFVQVLQLNQFDFIPSNENFLYLPLIFPRIHTLHLEDCLLIEPNAKRISPRWFLNSVQGFSQVRQLYHNQRLVFQMDRNKDGDQAEMARLVQLIEEEMFKVRP